MLIFQKLSFVCASGVIFRTNKWTFIGLSSLEEVKYCTVDTWGWSRLHKASMRADVESITALKTHTTVPLFTSVTYLLHLFACLSFTQHLEWFNVITQGDVSVFFLKPTGLKCDVFVGWSFMRKSGRDPAVKPGQLGKWEIVIVKSPCPTQTSTHGCRRPHPVSRR